MKSASGTSGASPAPTRVRLATKTITPAIAERPASSAIDASTSDVCGTPNRRIATTRAAGVQTPPGTYLASIESISACTATVYGTRIPSARRIHCQPTTNSR